MQRQEITEISIPRSCLQNPHDENPLQLLLESDTHLACIDEIISTITNAKLTSYIVVVNDNEPLSPQETIMLQAAQHYIAEYFKNLVHSENSTQGDSNSLATAAAAAAAVATVTAAASAATAALSEAAATETAAVVAAAATATVAATAAINTTTAINPANVVDKNAGTTVTDTLASDTNSLSENRSDTDSEPTKDPVLDKVLKIINLEIWSRKGRGFFGYSEPEGISDMKKLESASLNDIFNIATEKHCQSGLSSSTRANMTGRFYAMLFALRQADNTAARLNTLKDFATRELIANHRNLTSWGIGKVVLTDTDIAALCTIANIQPSDIESLANPTAAVAAAAAASASAVTDPDADEAPQTGLRP